jgi:hypothetical protein
MRLENRQPKEQLQQPTSLLPHPKLNLRLRHKARPNNHLQVEENNFHQNSLQYFFS